MSQRIEHLRAAMELMAGGPILQKPPIRRQTIESKRTNLPPIGSRNKKCSGCGHKNKKCTCK